MKPKVYDLFCGLDSGEAKSILGADSFVEQFVACWAKNPNHVTPAILHFATSIHTSEFRAMRNLNNSRFSAGLAGFWEVWIFPVKAFCYCSPSGSSRIVNRLHSWLASVKLAALTFPGFLRTMLGTIPAIRGRKNYLKMLSANLAVAPCLGDVELFSPSQSPGFTCALGRAVQPVRTQGGILYAA